MKSAPQSEIDCGINQTKSEMAGMELVFKLGIKVPSFNKLIQPSEVGWLSLFHEITFNILL